MRYIALGLLQVAGVIWLIHYAASEDETYSASRWERASNGGGAGYVVAALAIPSAIALAFLAMGLVPRWRRGALAVLAAVVYVLSLYAALFLLTPWN